MPTVPGFLPSISGFRFVNHFDGVPLREIEVGPINVPIGSASNGLCCGMVFAARDYFEAHSPPPPDDTPPSSGVLFDYFVDRLIDSWNLPNGPTKYLEWMNRSDHDIHPLPLVTLRGLAWWTIEDEWPKIQQDIDEGRLSALGVVQTKSRNPFDLGHNHQVLAYGYDLQGDDLAIYVYDPNEPKRDDMRLSLNIGSPTHTTAISYLPTRSVFGFFHVKYEFKSPPPVTVTVVVTPPATNEVPIRQWVGARGGWPRVRGDDDMDTGGNDIVPVSCATRVVRSDTALRVEIDFRCEEQGGDHTTFEGTRTFDLYGAPPGRRIVDVRYAVGTADVSLQGETHGKNHDVNAFDTNGTYWETLGFCVDAKGKDSEVVGVEGWFVATVVLAPV